MGNTITVLVGLVIAIVFAAVCWNLAGARDRSRVLWALLGFFFPVIALILLLVLGKKKPAGA